MSRDVTIVHVEVLGAPGPRGRVTKRVTGECGHTRLYDQKGRVPSVYFLCRECPDTPSTVRRPFREAIYDRWSKRMTDRSAELSAFEAQQSEVRRTRLAFLESKGPLKPPRASPSEPSEAE